MALGFSKLFRFSIGTQSVSIRRLSLKGHQPARNIEARNERAVAGGCEAKGLRFLVGADVAFLEAGANDMDIWEE